MARTTLSPARFPQPLDTYILYRPMVASLLVFVLDIEALYRIMNRTAFSVLALILLAVVPALFAPVIMGVLLTLVVEGWFMRPFQAVAYLHGFRSSQRWYRTLCVIPAIGCSIVSL